MRPAPAHLAVFTRLPQPGVSKTRLIGTLGAEGAAALQREMAEHVVRLTRILRATDGVSVEARITDGSCTEAQRWLRVACRPQGAGDLGARQVRALEAGLRAAPVSAVIGADCPTVALPLVRRALTAAARAGVAFIAADDGGYCLLAVSAVAAPALPDALGGVAWGTGCVLEQCLDGFRREGLAPVVLGRCSDIDLPDDLPAWHAVRRAWYEPPASLAVIVPVLNEAAVLPGLVESLAASGARVIVVDGGSVDGSADIARAAGAVVLEGTRGRAAQQNAGAAASDADALLFLHADTRPPDDFARLVLDALADPQLILGAFRFSLGATMPTLRLLEVGTRLRGSLLRMPYGDQGLFCRRAAFEALGGFPDMTVMEDYEFVRRARTAGTVRVLAEEAVTSDRRWREYGPWRWTGLNMATVARYHLGASAEELAAWRRTHSKR